MIVMKFGGTSVENAEAIDRVVRIVYARAHQNPVVVVSAMAGTTDQLLAMGSAAAIGDLKHAVRSWSSLRQRHIGTARQLWSGDLSRIGPDLDTDFDELKLVLHEVNGQGQLSPRLADKVASFGERLSSKIITGALCLSGLDAVLVDARACIVTDEAHTRAMPLLDRTNERLLATVMPLVEHGRVPVVGGFIGATETGVPTTIGRGGSDLTASIVGAALNATRIEIWTDVDGIMTTDPRLCPAAQSIASITFDEAAELAQLGAKVLHRGSLAPALAEAIPVYVLNSRNVNSRGTCITDDDVPEYRQRATAIAVKDEVTIVVVTCALALNHWEALKRVSEVLQRHRCQVDMLSTCGPKVSVAIDSREVPRALLTDLQQFASVECRPGKAIVSVIGNALHAMRGLAAKLLGEMANMDVHLISAGASTTSISFAIDSGSAPEVVRRVHSMLFAGCTSTHPPS